MVRNHSDDSVRKYTVRVGAGDGEFEDVNDVVAITRRGWAWLGRGYVDLGLAGLESGKTYYIRIRGHNNSGPGAESEVVVHGG